MATFLQLGDISVEVARKDIKNVHLSVYGIATVLAVYWVPWGKR